MHSFPVDAKCVCIRNPNAKPVRARYPGSEGGINSEKTGKYTKPVVTGVRGSLDSKGSTSREQVVETESKPPRSREPVEEIRGSLDPSEDAEEDDRDPYTIKKKWGDNNPPPQMHVTISPEYLSIFIQAFSVCPELRKRWENIGEGQNAISITRHIVSSKTKITYCSLGTPAYNPGFAGGSLQATRTSPDPSRRTSLAASVLRHPDPRRRLPTATASPPTMFSTRWTNCLKGRSGNAWRMARRSARRQQLPGPHDN